ncbi:MAG TPA: flagellar assembly protein FliW [Bryobacteraceae bacterium]|nr:flagellar assembly protein FliW [Bryobacteraceae bacterium]
MPEIDTTNFGTISFAPESIFEFPNGLPGFDERRRFLPVQNPRTAPLLFLQSLEDPALCFTTLPIWVVDPHYRLHITAQDLELLGFAANRQPRIGSEVLCLAVLSLRPAGTTANLLAPVVVNLKNYKAVQAVSPELRYSHQQPLFPEGAAAC